MHWLLIAICYTQIYSVGGSTTIKGHGTQLTLHEFATKGGCESAAAEIRAMDTTIKIKCVLK